MSSPLASRSEAWAHASSTESRELAVAGHERQGRYELSIVERVEILEPPVAHAR